MVESLKDKLEAYHGEAVGLEIRRIALADEIKKAVASEVPNIMEVIPIEYSVSENEIEVSPHYVGRRREGVPDGFYVSLKLRRNGELIPGADRDEKVGQIQHYRIFRQIEEKYGISKVCPDTQPINKRVIL